MPPQTIRRAALVGGLLTLLSAAPALGADAAVTVADKAFAPADVSIAPGESVTWSWREGGHNVHALEGPARFDSGFKETGGTFARAFTAVGTYRYVCDAHPSMRGSVTVGTATAAGPAPALALPTAPLRFSAVSVSRLAVVRLRASAAGRVRAQLRRGRRVVKRWTMPVAAGENRLPLAVRGVQLGRYRVELHALDGTRVVHRVSRSLVVTRAARSRRMPIVAPVPASAAPAPLAPAPAPDAPDDSDGRLRPGDSDDRPAEDR